MASTLTWRGAALKRQVGQAAVAAVDEIDLRIEGAAKQELYPGHGKLTGTLQRDIHSDPARVDGRRVRGAVGTRRIPYAMALHRRYKYLTIGLRKVQPQTGAILARHLKGGSR